MRKKLVIANWKMNLNYSQVKALTTKISKNNFKNKIIIAPSNLYLKTVFEICKQNPNIAVSAQNVSEFDNGAYTGEVSAQMLSSLSINYSIVGHSERRLHFSERSHNLIKKVYHCLSNNLVPILCVGENEQERNKSKHFAVVKKQIINVLRKIDVNEIQKLMIAYEPVWAIGTGKTASSFEAQEMHVHIRNFIKENFSSEISQTIKIIYGGSCNKNNAKDLLCQNDIDGVLVGGASLIFDDLIEIIRISELY